MNGRRAAERFASGRDSGRLVVAPERLEDALNGRGIDARRSGRCRTASGFRLSSSVLERVLLLNDRRRTSGCLRRRTEDALKIGKDLALLRDKPVEVLRRGLFVGDGSLYVLIPINGRDRARVLFDICGSSACEGSRRHIKTSNGRDKREGISGFGRELFEKVGVLNLCESRFEERGFLLHLSLRRQGRGSGFRSSGDGFGYALNARDVGLPLLLSKCVNPSAVRCFGGLLRFGDREVLLLSDAAERALLRLLSKEDVPSGCRSPCSGRGGLECHRLELARRRALTDARRTLEPGPLLFGKGFPGTLALAKALEFRRVRFGEKLLRGASLSYASSGRSPGSERSGGD